MRFLYFIIFFFVSGHVLAQLPSIKTNATKKDSLNSILLQKFKDSYDFALAYTESSYWWRNVREHKIFAHKNSIWTSYLIREEKNKKGKIKTRISKQRLSADSAMKLIDQLTSRNFWTLDNDSLNQTGVPINDSMVSRMQVFDGANQRFEVITKQGFRIIESYEPEAYFEKFPQMIVRKSFIDCRRIFVSAWTNNRS